MKSSFTLGSILGIPIRINASWLLVALLVTLSLAGGTFPAQYPGWSPMIYWLIGTCVSVLVGIVLLLGQFVLSLLEND